jgi:hypothetical protein
MLRAVMVLSGLETLLTMVEVEVVAVTLAETHPAA